MKAIPDNAIMFVDDGRIHYFMVPDATEHTFTGTVYEVGGWEADGTPVSYAGSGATFEEVAVIYLKWDGCGHVGFRSPEMGKNWVHVCGEQSMARTLAMLRWMWVEARHRIAAYDSPEADALTH